MIFKIEGENYTYRGDNICSFSATMDIYKDDGITKVDSTGLNASANVTEPDFVASVQAQLREQRDAYINKLTEIEALRIAVIPESTDFEDAVKIIFAPIKTEIGAE